MPPRLQILISIACGVGVFFPKFVADFAPKYSGISLCYKACSNLQEFYVLSRVGIQPFDVVSQLLCSAKVSGVYK
jgi:hypothetical protein